MRQQAKFEIFFIICFAMISLGAGQEFQWPWQKKQAKQEEKKLLVQHTARTLSDQNAQPEEPKEKESVRSEKEETAVQVNPIAAARPVAAIPKPPPTRPIFDSPEQEISKIQDDLSHLTKQSQAIQAQGIADRQKLQSIMEKVRIQQKLLKNLQPPTAQLKTPTSSAEEVLRNTKVRLIAEDVKKTQADLERVATITPIRTKNVQPIVAKKIQTH